MSRNEAIEVPYNESCASTIILLEESGRPLFKVPGDENLVTVLIALSFVHRDGMTIAEIQIDVAEVHITPHLQAFLATCGQKFFFCQVNMLYRTCEYSAFQAIPAESE